MKCPNCQKLFVKEQAGKFQCEDCGWFEKVDDEWRVCEPPSPEPEPEPQPPEPAGPQPPEPAGLEPPEPAGPQPPDPTGPQPPEPERKVKKILGGFITITEVDE
jgi:hypothetical protein